MSIQAKATYVHKNIWCDLEVKAFFAQVFVFCLQQVVTDASLHQLFSDFTVFG